MPSLQVYAEHLKLDINSRYEDRLYRNKELSGDTEFECGGTMPNSYSYDDIFTKSEYEDCIEPLLGKKYSYQDYKTIEGKEQTTDIIWPVLDVLRKAAKKLGSDDVKVDAVILSGGMSRLYLIKNRLDEFFGFNTISVQDPDQAVAQGAVVYHYYQHHDSELMKRLHEKERFEAETLMRPDTDQETDAAPVKEESVPSTGFIKTGNYVLADAVYLGLKGGATSMLADEGQTLPYKSDINLGFKILKGQDKVCVPIKKKGSGKDLITIASGVITFKNKPNKDIPVGIEFEINKNQIITIEAFTYDEVTKCVIEKGTTTFSFGPVIETTQPKGVKEKIVPSNGSVLIPANEISSLMNLLRSRYPDAALIKTKKSSIAACGNPADFGLFINRALNEAYNRSENGVCNHLIPLARRLLVYWSDKDRNEFLEICKRILSLAANPYRIRAASWTSVYNETILTIGKYGSEKDAEKLLNDMIITNKGLQSSLVQAFAYKGMKVDWIIDLVFQKVPAAYRWVGFAISNLGSLPEKTNIDKLVNCLLDGTIDIYGRNKYCVNSIISLGLICDSRKGINKVSDIMRNRIEKELLSNYRQYPQEISSFTTKPLAIALKLIRYQELDSNDEEYLLSLYEE